MNSRRGKRLTAAGFRVGSSAQFLDLTPEMDSLSDGLSRVMQPAEVGRWLKQPNSAFDGSTPLQVVERGEIDRIWRMLYDLESGQPG
jgi:hypothetical protein